MNNIIFKRLFSLSVLSLLSISLYSQQNQNYIIERVYQQAGGKEDSALVTVKYFDGLGRPLQTVAVGMSPSRKDIVTPIGYDALGREHRKYLPYEDSSATGLYRPHDLTPAGYTNSEQYKYYSKTLTNTNTDIPDTDYPFAETVFEASPLNRVLEQGAPGEAWQPSSASISGSGHTVGMVYGTNAAEEVVLWDVDASGSLLKDGFYDAGTLYMTQTTDENGVASREYKDLQGQVVLKMAAVDNSVQTRTYYAYDDLGHLRYVLPPEFVAGMDSTASFTASSDLVKKFGYYYAYDGRGRMTVKQLPGAGAVRMVYDVRDRLIATQDSVQRDSSKWLITKYDALNRPVATAVYPFSQGQDSLQRYANTFTEGNLYETPDNSKAHGYSERAFPGDVDDSSYLTVTYYDGYTQLTTANGFNQLGFVPKPGLIAYSGGNGFFTGTRGLVTGTKTRVLGTNEWLYGVTYYDDRYRPIQTRGTLYGGAAGDGYTASTRYDFSGKVLRAEEVQVFGGVATTTTTGNTYDHVGRLLTTTQQVTHNGTSTGTVTVAQNQYSALGQLREKNLANGAQSVDYTYNIRGWLTSINNPDDLTAPGNGDTHADLFGMRLSYSEANATEALPQYNGNIAGVVWSTNHNALKRSAYGYSYDALNRLTGSDYWTTPSSALANSTAYEERGISYDLNGNIKTLVRTKGDGTLRDSLAYTYSGNRLTQLNSWNGYAYDGNGNMTTDGMRGFSVEYNLLNLPKKVSKNTSNISYIYSATGAKLAMLDTNTVRNYYAGTCVYKGDRTLDYALHPEGVVRVTTSTSGVKSLSYEYFLKDHLGNTRVVFDGNDSVLQATDYYAFGMAHTPKVQENENRYLYNGKEQQDAVLGGVQFDWYDYGARFYDPFIGRWHGVDPFAEMTHNLTPYNYSINNPVRFIDPDGMVVAEGGGTDPTKLYGKQIDMSQCASGGSNAAGYPRNGPWFWKQMLKKFPEMFSKENVIRINSRQAPHIDETWLKYNPSHSGYTGKLVHHHINQSNMATGIPEEAHIGMSKQLHRFLGKARGTLNVFAIGLVALDFFSGNPHSMGSMIETRKVGKLYYDQESNNYFEITSKTINKDDNGNEVSADITMNVYSSYTYDEEQGKYVGTGEKTTVTTTVYKGEKAKKMFINLLNNGYI